MTHNTATEQGRQQRLEELVEKHRQSGNGVALVRLIGGSIEDFDERWDPSNSGSHPDERYQ